jgi:hypothetical protein
MLDSWTTHADRVEAQLRVGVYGRLSETYDAADSVPTQLDRGTGDWKDSNTDETG